MKFKNGKEMLDFIQAGNDIYNREKELYIFVYNENGALCYYYISNKQADALKDISEELGDSWSALLGAGGKIVEGKKKDEWFNDTTWCNRIYNGEWEVVN